MNELKYFNDPLAYPKTLYPVLTTAALIYLAYGWNFLNFSFSS